MIWKNDKLLELKLANNEGCYINSSRIIMIVCGIYPWVNIIIESHKELLVDVSKSNNLANIEYIVGYKLEFEIHNSFPNRPKAPLSSVKPAQ